MPKIVPNIHNSILEIAEKHFKELGFQDADMRKIASEADIAVGTIYLHYHNKEQLYRSVIENKWTNLVLKMEWIAKQEQPAVERFRQMLVEIVRNMADRKSMDNLWMEIGLIHHQAALDGDAPGPHNPVVAILASELCEIYGKAATENIRLVLEQIAAMTFMMIIDVCLRGQENYSQNIELIIDMVTTYIKNIEDTNQRR